MKRKTSFIGGAALAVLALWMVMAAFEAPQVVPNNAWTEETPVYEALWAMGEPYPKHWFRYDRQMVKRGEEIVKYGRTIGPDGKRSKYVSKYYVCTTCHNIEREDPDLRVSDPEARLPYVKKKGIPFLQGTTFRGIVNRESWYNDDYVRKYGEEKIQRAHKSLREAIQLCAIECSQGRPMERWEIDAVLAYYWTLQWKLGDLGLTKEDLARLNAIRQDPARYEEGRKWLKSLYLQKSPAHFFDAPPDKVKGYGFKGDPAIGKDIYELSCQYCHRPGGVSHLILDDARTTFEWMKKYITKDSHLSLYQIIAYGTYAIPGHRPYMPHYPLERMSKKQVEDLRAYIELRADGGTLPGDDPAGPFFYRNASDE